MVHGKNPSPKPYLVPAEENELSQFLVDVAQAGYGKTRRQVMTIAESVACDKGVLKPGRRISRGGLSVLRRDSLSSHCAREMQQQMYAWTVSILKLCPSILMY